MILETERSGLSLHLLDADVLDEYYALVDRNRDHLTRYGDYPELGAATLESLREDLSTNPDHADRFGIRLDGSLIGRVDLVPREPGIYVLGYWLDETQTRHGYVTAACRTAIDHVCAHDAATIWAGVTKGNEPSAGVLGRLGFRSVEDMGTYVRYRLDVDPRSEGFARAP